MSFKPINKRYCMNYSYFSGELTADDMEFLSKMLQRYKAKVMLEGWVKLGQMKIPGGSKVDQDKARVVDIVRRRCFCWRERCLVSAVDVACYAWTQKQPRN